MIDCHRLIGFFLSAKRPLVFAGNGLRRNSGELVEILNLLQIPLLISTHAKGSVNEIEDCFYGCFGFASPESSKEFLKNYNPDLTLFLATSLGELATQGWAPELFQSSVKVHINRDPRVFRSHLSMTYNEVGTVSDVVFALKLLQLKKSSFQIFAQFPKASAARLVPNEALSQSPIKPEHLVDLLPNLLPSSCLVVSDIGNSMAWLMNRFDNFGDHELYVPIAMGSMGSGIGMAIGAKLASPQKAVVCVSGDGAMVMHGNEVLTAVENNLGVVFLILNDGGHGMVDHGHRIIGAGDPKVRWKEPVDFVSLAKAFGARGIKIQTLDELEKIDFEKLTNDSIPTVLDLQISPLSVPPILARARVLGQADVVAGKQSK